MISEILSYFAGAFTTVIPVLFVGIALGFWLKDQDYKKRELEVLQKKTEKKNNKELQQKKLQELMERETKRKEKKKEKNNESKGLSSLVSCAKCDVRIAVPNCSGLCFQCKQKEDYLDA
jgi:hypothetical protein